MSSDKLDWLRTRLSQPLPGWDAQVQMAPDGGRERQRIPGANAKVRRSAVLLLLHTAELYPEQAKKKVSATADESAALKVLLTVRSRRLNHHGGQISLPGGGIDSNENVQQAAMREACEEVGIREKDVEVIGEMTPLYIPVSRNIVYPILGFHHGQFAVRLQEEEVEEAFSVPLGNLKQPNAVQWREQDFKGQTVRYPFWNVHRDVPLWGATAMILRELLELYEFDS